MRTSEFRDVLQNLLSDLTQMASNLLAMASQPKHLPCLQMWSQVFKDTGTPGPCFCK